MALNVLNSSDKDTIFTASHDLLQPSHVFYVLLIDGGVPKDHTEVGSLWLFEGENQGAVEVGPEILGLDVSKQDV